MSLLLTLEQGPRSQAVRQARLDKGELTIGRDAEAGWRIDDPDMYVSRVHCLVQARSGGYVVTDKSTGGLFIDESESPLGRDNSASLTDGMRLRLGDYVLHVEVLPEHPAAAPHHPAAAPQQPAPRQPAPAVQPVPSRAPVSLGSDDFFASKMEEAPPPPRPGNLPDPFDHDKPGAFRFPGEADSAPRSAAFDDPFSLDPVATPGAADEAPAPDFDFASSRPLAVPAPRSMPASEPPRSLSFDDFATGPLPPAQRLAESARSAAASPQPAPWELPLPEAPAIPEPEPVAEPPPATQDASAEAVPQSAAPAVEPKPRAPAPRRAAPVDAAGADLLAAFMRGAGMDEGMVSDRGPEADLEKLGREYRLMMDGLMQLLRKRAEEKGNARLATTVIGATNVNPLKTLPAVDDALAMIFSERSPGFLAGEAAIGDAVRDLAEHHIRAWRGVQGALRRMIDRFDPVAIEAELKSGAGITGLLPGGRGAKLWDLYQKRHREIAQSAEQRFLGEIGADFRDAYEED